MKVLSRLAKNIIIILSLFIILLLVLVMIFSMGKETQKSYDELVTPTHSVRSPSGDYILSVDQYTDNGLEYYYFVVEDSTSGEELYRSEEPFKRIDTDLLLWGENDEIWLYNDGGAGIYYYTLDKENTVWTGNLYFIGVTKRKVPIALIELRPQYFNPEYF